MNTGYVRTKCELYHGNRSELQCQKTAVLCLYPSRTGVCRRDLNALIQENYFGRKA